MLPPGECSYQIVKRRDGWRVVVTRGEVRVPVTEIVEKVQALRVAQRLSDRAHDLLEAFRKGLRQ